MIFSASKPAAIAVGGSEFENKYGLARCRSISITGCGPATYPPIAPPNALPRVPVKISTFTPKCSGVPFPLFPTNPVA